MSDTEKIYPLEPNEADGNTVQPLRLDEAALIKLMRCLEATMEDACSCDEAFALLDEYVELVASNERASQVMPLVKNHMTICSDCREEFETLLNILKAEAAESDSH